MADFNFDFDKIVEMGEDKSIKRKQQQQIQQEGKKLKKAAEEDSDSSEEEVDDEFGESALNSIPQLDTVTRGYYEALTWMTLKDKDGLIPNPSNAINEIHIAQIVPLSFWVFITNYLNQEIYNGNRNRFQINRLARGYTTNIFDNEEKLIYPIELINFKELYLLLQEIFPDKGGWKEICRLYVENCGNVIKRIDTEIGDQILALTIEEDEWRDKLSLTNMPFDDGKNSQTSYKRWVESIFPGITRHPRTLETSTFSVTLKSEPKSQCQIAMSEDWRGGDVCSNNDCICYICNQKVTTELDIQNDEDKILTPLRAQCEHILPFMTAIRFSWLASLDEPKRSLGQSYNRAANLGYAAKMLIKLEYLWAHTCCNERPKSNREYITISSNNSFEPSDVDDKTSSAYKICDELANQNCPLGKDSLGDPNPTVILSDGTPVSSISDVDDAIEKYNESVLPVIEGICVLLNSQIHYIGGPEIYFAYSTMKTMSIFDERILSSFYALDRGSTLITSGEFSNVTTGGGKKKSKTNKAGLLGLFKKKPQDKYSEQPNKKMTKRKPKENLKKKINEGLNRFKKMTKKAEQKLKTKIDNLRKTLRRSKSKTKSQKSKAKPTKSSKSQKSKAKPTKPKSPKPKTKSPKPKTPPPKPKLSPLYFSNIPLDDEKLENFEDKLQGFGNEIKDIVSKTKKLYNGVKNKKIKDKERIKMVLELAKNIEDILFQIPDLPINT